MIKAIIFDFFGVICTDDYWKFVKEDRTRPGKFGRLAEAVNLGELSWEAFLEKVSSGTNQPVEEVRRMYESEKINLPLLSYIDKLHEKYKTALLTNASEDFLLTILKKTHLDHIFDEVIISSTLGMAKPNPEIFRHALKNLTIKAQEAVFIDDTLRHVEAARSLGIHSLLYKDLDQLKNELEPLLAGSDN